MVDLSRLKELTTELAIQVRILGEHTELIELLELIFDNIQSIIFIIDNNDNIVSMNNAASVHASECGANIEVGDKWYKMWKLSDPPPIYPSKRAIETRRILTSIQKSPVSDKTFFVTVIPLIYNGVSGTINICEEVTDA